MELTVRFNLDNKSPCDKLDMSRINVEIAIEALKLAMNIPEMTVQTPRTNRFSRLKTVFLFILSKRDFKVIQFC